MSEENIQRPPGPTGLPLPGTSSDGVAAGPPAPVPPPPAPAPTPSLPQERKARPLEHKDGTREIVETVVFVVVLVLLLKTFLAEAFVIPTGSMATNLLGYHKKRVCDQCGYPFLVNASDEAERGAWVSFGICPNCLYKNDLGPQAPGKESEP